MKNKDFVWLKAVRATDLHIYCGLLPIEEGYEKRFRISVLKKSSPRYDKTEAAALGMKEEKYTEICKKHGAKISSTNFEYMWEAYSYFTNIADATAAALELYHMSKIRIFVTTYNEYGKEKVIAYTFNKPRHAIKKLRSLLLRYKNAKVSVICDQIIMIDGALTKKAIDELEKYY